MGHSRWGRKNFYPRSPCGERPSYSQHVTRPSLYFYPRSPCGERRYTNFGNSRGLVISIHALLAESDHRFALCGCLPRYFYPRSPCGERLANLRGLYSEAIFLSTLSLRRATRILSTSRAFSVISIHALLAESDSLPVWCYPTQ